MCQLKCQPVILLTCTGTFTIILYDNPPSYRHKIKRGRSRLGCWHIQNNRGLLFLRKIMGVIVKIWELVTNMGHLRCDFLQWCKDFCREVFFLKFWYYNWRAELYFLILLFPYYGWLVSSLLGPLVSNKQVKLLTNYH